MDQEISVVPKEFIKTSLITQASVKIVNLELGNQVSLYVFLKDEAGNLFEAKFITIAGDEYQNWGNDDNYLITVALEKCGLTRS